MKLQKEFVLDKFSKKKKKKERKTNKLTIVSCGTEQMLSRLTYIALEKLVMWQRLNLMGYGIPSSFGQHPQVRNHIFNSGISYLFEAKHVS